MGVAATASAVGRSNDPDSDRYIVVLKDTVRHPGAAARAQVGAENGRLGFVYRSALNGYSAALSASAVERLRQDPRVAYIESDVRGGIAAQTTPTGIDRIFATGNETLDIDGEDDVRVDVDVAILDTGTDHEHPDLDVVARTDCSNGTEEAAECVDESGSDGNSHGTHVGGTVGAIDNGEGVVGVAPGARLWSVKVLDSAGSGFLSEYIAGIDWVTEHAEQIEVANSSLRYFITSSSAFSEAMAASVDAGVVHVVAAGNESETVKYVPGNHADVITVSALADYNGEPGGGASPTCASYGADDKLASFSNFGTTVEVAAPGVCIYSTIPNESYGMNSGTSMASPHVAGAAAILAGVSNPDSQADVESIRSTLEEQGNSNWEDTSGDGELEPLLDVSNEEVFVGYSTEPAPPEANTGSATQVQPTSATLNGTVDPNNLETTYQFEYGTTVEYGSKAPASPKGAGEGGSAVAVSEAVEGLEEGTTYHFRLVATNSEGTDYGSDMTFVTASAGEWTAESSPNKSEAEGSAQSLTDVDCFSAEWCMAVGSYSNGEGSGALAEHWDGKEWSIVATPSGFSMHDVVCHSATECAAVGSKEGQAHIERWLKAGGWFSMSLPSIEGTVSGLNGISCTGSFPALRCFAVGSHTVSGEERTLALRWTGSWGLHSTPDPGEGSALNAVYCSGESDCVAVGHYLESAESHPLALDWNGSEWSSESVPDPESEGEDTHLNDVSCTGAGSGVCVSVGDNEGGSPQSAISMVREGGKWTEQQIAEPGEGTAASLSSVSCSGEGLCGAVGTVGLESTTAPLAEVFWTGSGWSAEKAEDPSEGGGAFLGGVSCDATEDCLAVGGYTGASADLTLIERRGPAEEAEPKAPTATTEAATGVSVSKATLHGTVNPNGLETTYQFEYGTTESYGSKAPASPKGIGEGTSGVAVEETVESLEPETTYHFRVVGTNSKGTTYGKDKTFTTEAEPKAPTATTEAATGVSVSKATLHGTVNPNGLETTYQFEYGTTESYGSKAPASPKGIGAGSSGVAVEETIEGLEPETTYHFRVVGTNSKGTTYGKDKTFTTEAEPKAPTATTEAATGVTDAKATLNGTVNPNGLETTYQFEYGTTESYGSKAPASPKGIGAGSSGVAVEETIEGLEPETTYHFRVLGTNSKGTTYGKDKTFATEAAPEEPEWTIEATANPSEAEGSEQSLTDVSCYSESFCMAVGSYTNGEGSGALAEYWDGEAWTIVSVPAGVTLNTVVCRPFPNECAAAGRKEGQLWAARWNKAFPALWFDMKPPAPEGAESSEFNGGDCSPKNEIYECVVVGSYTISGEERPLAMEWIIAKQEWEDLSPPTEGEDSSFNAISCNEEGSCTAIGYYVESGAEHPLAVHWNGSEWSAQSVPDPEAEGEDTRLSDITCTGEAGPNTECVAVGANDGGAPQVGVGMFWDGEEWKEAAPGAPSGLEGDYALHGVSCVSQSECYAVGEYDSAAEGAEARTLAREWNGSEWSASPTPNPEGKAWSGLRGVSCRVEVKCLAVGFGASEARTDTLAMRHE